MQNRGKFSGRIVGMGAKEDESSTGHVWAAGFHYVTACTGLVRFETYEPFIIQFSIFFRATVYRG
jgi:hypothetical protein